MLLLISGGAHFALQQRANLKLDHFRPSLFCCRSFQKHKLFGRSFITSSTTRVMSEFAENRRFYYYYIPVPRLVANPMCNGKEEDEVCRQSSFFTFCSRGHFTLSKLVVVVCSRWMTYAFLPLNTTWNVAIILPLGCSSTHPQYFNKQIAKASFIYLLHAFIRAHPSPLLQFAQLRTED